METVKIVFWSQGGNTAAMAAAVAEGVQEAGSKAEIINVSDASAADLQRMKGYALPWEQKFWKKWKWSPSCVNWKEALPARV